MIRILLLDDHAVVREGLRLLLDSQADLQVAGDASTAPGLRAFLAAKVVDVLLLDLNLPGTDGALIARYVRETYPTIRVLVLSMASQAERVVELFAAGASGYVLKTSGFAEITQGIRTVAVGKRFLCSALGLAALKTVYNPACVAEAASSKYSADTIPSRPLSRREAQVLQLLAEGLSNQEMAERLFTSRRTVETHRQNLLAKMQVKNTAALMRLATSNGWVQ